MKSKSSLVSSHFISVTPAACSHPSHNLDNLQVKPPSLVGWKCPANWQLFLIAVILRLVDTCIRISLILQDYFAFKSGPMDLVFTLIEDLIDPVITILPMWLFGAIVSDFRQKCRNIATSYQQQSQDRASTQSHIPINASLKNELKGTD